ncbi:molybdate ABC transporter permease subunit [Phototrophicus methaneseepsis]|uniref:Molybdenum transport system permease n=1 Tax=Phototrophicus methaneseepsis TaxID=2710758 RepID=A0A7S8IGP7_9CHLR|nr:ABC transporter permease [Phototrophicus methaneseepsis]QPC85021.1 molybdate ABC transporter permease subunit [Phototrophicus methaneseepsis]
MSQTALANSFLRKSAFRASILLALLFFVLPLFALTLTALVGIERAMMNADAIVTAALLSLVTTGISTLLTLTIGTPFALWLARGSSKFKSTLKVIMALPVVMPPAVAGLALLLTFGRRGLLGPLLEEAGISLPFTMAAVVMAQVFVSAPFYIRASVAGFEAVHKEYEDAARLDGAAEWQVIRYVTIPMSMNALSAGLVLSWARGLGEFGATILFAGSLQGTTQTLPLLVYNIFERDLYAAAWVGMILIGFAFLTLMLSQWLSTARNNS